VIALVVALACLTFLDIAAGLKGVGGSSLSCRAPIVAGWSGGRPERKVPGGIEYDTGQQCGYDARNRLIGAGVVALAGVAGLSAALWRGLREYW